MNESSEPWSCQSVFLALVQPVEGSVEGGSVLVGEVCICTIDRSQLQTLQYICETLVFRHCERIRRRFSD